MASRAGRPGPMGSFWGMTAEVHPAARASVQPAGRAKSRDCLQATGRTHVCVLAPGCNEVPRPQAATSRDATRAQEHCVRMSVSTTLIQKELTMPEEPSGPRLVGNKLSRRSLVKDSASFKPEPT